MKKVLLFMAASLLSLAAVAQNQVVGVVDTHETTKAGAPARRVLPIVVDEIITNPEGTVVADVQRKGFSYYYASGSLYGGYNDSFVGEYVLGTDGSIYIKNPCASVNFNSYIKLDKVDEENYVCHTAQLVYVYDTGTGTPYTYFATRLVFKQYSEYSMGYVVEEVDGEPQCDVYFTFKNGVLKQKDQTLETLNDITYPHELIGLTNSSGGWIGYGDGCIEFIKSEEVPTTLPEGAEVKTGSFAYNVLASKSGRNASEAVLTKYAEVGDEFYTTTPLSENMWVKGTINRTEGTVTFLPQYIGTNNAVHQWFMPAAYTDRFDVWDEEDGDGYYSRSMEATEAYVCKYENGAVVSDPADKQAFVVSRNETELLASGAYANAVMRPYTEQGVAPVKPFVNYVEPSNGMWSEFRVAVSNVDNNMTYLNPENLYYRIYTQKDSDPFVFDPDDYMDFTTATTDIPSTEDNMDIETNGVFHCIYFYDSYKDVGVQAVYKLNGQEYVSPIAWWGEKEDPTAINDVVVEKACVARKLIIDGQVVIEKNGKRFNIMGQPVK